MLRAHRDGQSILFQNWCLNRYTWIWNAYTKLNFEQIVNVYQAWFRSCRSVCKNETSERARQRCGFYHNTMFGAWMESYCKCIISIVVRCKTDFHYISHHVKPLLAFTIHTFTIWTAMILLVYFSELLYDVDEKTTSTMMATTATMMIVISVPFYRNTCSHYIFVARFSKCARVP